MRRSALILVTLTIINSVSTGPAEASSPASRARVNTVIGTGAWASPLGARSTCSQIATATVACSHDATSISIGVETCVGEGTTLPLVKVTVTCHAELSGITSGAGVATGEQAAVGCNTLGIQTGRLDFSDTQGNSYPPATVTIVNIGGHANFFGEAVDASGIAVAHTEGTFELACGSPVNSLRGAFTGSYTLL